MSDQRSTSGSVISSLSGALDIMLGRESGMQKFDLSADGFWHSFFGLGLAAFVHAVMKYLDHHLLSRLGNAPEHGVLVSIVILLFVALVAYAASMLALYLLCRTDEMRSRFSIAVIAHNWAAPIIGLIFLPVLLLMYPLRVSAHPEPPGFVEIALIVAPLTAVVIAGIRLLRISLNIYQGQAVGIFLATAFVSLVIEIWLSRLFGL